ncbi:protein phosphatase 1 regulatory subunit 35 [Xenopus laevis]|uniref:Protein phosphatase 1 regulatory subunit 35 n=1 Tax=Xenopus laevis TaxID=8355 RepID=A0A8J0U5E5_XENLA|nr:protein phosphatase 1 regulatory subunit 35 [Xenopus laevis]OCT59631.1 hypothetical protein XELAEV_18001053mg [Xenopus laevis]
MRVQTCPIGVTMAALPLFNSMVLTAPATGGSHAPGTYKMSAVRTLSARECEDDEGDAIPCNFVPQPLPLGVGGGTESHPLLDISLTPDKGGGILRRKSWERGQVQRQVRFVLSEESRSRGRSHELGVGLQCPRMHSTAGLKEQVQREVEQQFHADSAVQRELERSYRVRRSIESEAARALNVGRAQTLYQGLMSVEPPAEHVQRLSEKPRRVEAKEAPQLQAPDLSAFSHLCERFTETPYLTVEGPPPLTICPRPRPSHTAFDMYHKLKEWAP